MAREKGDVGGDGGGRAGGGGKGGSNALEDWNRESAFRRTRVEALRRRGVVGGDGWR